MPWASRSKSCWQKSAARNERDGITGILFAAGGLFYQVIEGPPDKVDALYDKIAHDQRHNDVLLLSAEEDVQDRLFPDWAMKSFVFEPEASLRLEPLREIIATLHEQRQRIDSLTETLDRAVWSELQAFAVDHGS